MHKGAATYAKIKKKKGLQFGKAKTKVQRGVPILCSKEKSLSIFWERAF